MERQTKKMVFGIIKFALIMILFSLAFGVAYREISRPFVEGLTLDIKQTVIHQLGLVHGHSLSLGFLVPVALAFITHFLTKSLTEKKLKSLKRAFIVYIIGLILSLGLMIFKGVSIVVMYSPNGGFEGLDESLFFGNAILRSLLYTIAHLTYAVGLVWYSLSLFRTKLNLMLQR